MIFSDLNAFAFIESFSQDSEVMDSWKKIHFYTGAESLATIDSADELQQAVSAVKYAASADSYSKDQSRSVPDNMLTITVEFESNITSTYDYSENVGMFDDRVGAGIIDLGELLGSNTYYTVDNANRAGSTEILSKDVYLINGSTLKIGLAWLVTAESGVGYYLTDYDIRVYDSSGNLLVSSTLGSSNVEMICKTITTTGIYRIVLYQFTAQSDTVTKEYISLTYNT